MEYFLGSNLDYHIGVISTDTFNDAESGKLIPGPGGILWIDPTTPDPVDAFAGMAVLGNHGGAPEKGILATYEAFEYQTEHNAGFFRDADNSDINIIVVSDESDYSGTDPISIGEFEDYLNNKRADPDKVSFHGIVTPPPPTPLCAGVASPGTRYVDVINAVGGVYWSLCSNDWSGALEAIGLQTAGLKREYFLTQLPVEGTVKVSVEYLGATQVFTEYDPNTGLGDWTYSPSRNSVTFTEYVPESGANVEIAYDVLSASEHE
jgi:hypothetical protein